MHQHSRDRRPRRSRERERTQENIWRNNRINFPNMGKEIVNQVQEAQRVPCRINPRRNTPRHIVIKMMKIKDKDKILKATREKWQHTRELPSGCQVISQQKRYKPEGDGRIYFKWWKGRTFNQEHSTQQDSRSDLMGEIKSFPDKQKLREFSTIKPVLQQMLKELL